MSSDDRQDVDLCFEMDGLASSNKYATSDVEDSDSDGKQNIFK